MKPLFRSMAAGIVFTTSVLSLASPAMAKDVSISTMEDPLSMIGISAQLSPDTIALGSGGNSAAPARANMFGVRVSPIDFASFALLGGYGGQSAEIETTANNRISTTTFDSSVKVFDAELLGRYPVKNFRIGAGFRLGYAGWVNEEKSRNNSKTTTIDYGTTAIKVFLDAEYLIADQFAIGLAYFAYSSYSGDGEVVLEETDNNGVTTRVSAPFDASISGSAFPAWLTFTAYLAPRKAK